MKSYLVFKICLDLVLLCVTCVDPKTHTKYLVVVVVVFECKTREEKGCEQQYP